MRHGGWRIAAIGFEFYILSVIACPRQLQSMGVIAPDQVKSSAGATFYVLNLLGSRKERRQRTFEPFPSINAPDVNDKFSRVFSQWPRERPSIRVIGVAYRSLLKHLRYCELLLHSILHHTTVRRKRPTQIENGDPVLNRCFSYGAAGPVSLENTWQQQFNAMACDRTVSLEVQNKYPKLRDCWNGLR